MSRRRVPYSTRPPPTSHARRRAPPSPPPRPRSRPSLWRSSWPGARRPRAAAPRWRIPVTYTPSRRRRLPSHWGAVSHCWIRRPPPPRRHGNARTHLPWRHRPSITARVSHQVSSRSDDDDDDKLSRALAQCYQDFASSIPIGSLGRWTVPPPRHAQTDGQLENVLSPIPPVGWAEAWNRRLSVIEQTCCQERTGVWDITAVDDTTSLSGCVSVCAPLCVCVCVVITAVRPVGCRCRVLPLTIAHLLMAAAAAAAILSTLHSPIHYDVTLQHPQHRSCPVCYSSQP